MDDVSPECVRVLLNRDAVGPFLESMRDGRSFALLGDVDITCKELMELL